MKPKIIAAAIRWRGAVFTGVRHGEIIEQIVKLGQITEEERPITGEPQGFIDEFGIFRTRAIAKLMAISAGQIKADHKGELYSEDLW